MSLEEQVKMLEAQLAQALEIIVARRIVLWNLSQI